MTRSWIIAFFVVVLQLLLSASSSGADMTMTTANDERGHGEPTTIMEISNDDIPCLPVRARTTILSRSERDDRRYLPLRGPRAGSVPHDRTGSRTTRPHPRRAFLQNSVLLI